MAEKVEIISIEEQPTVVVRLRATYADLAATIREGMDLVYSSTRKRNAGGLGPNIVLYHGAPERDLLSTSEGLALEVGIQVSALLAFDGSVVPSKLPGGRVAHFQHRGGFDKLPEAHMTVRSFCAKKGEDITGVNWEVYGEWHSDPKKLRTEVYYLLK